MVAAGTYMVGGGGAWWREEEGGSLGIGGSLHKLADKVTLTMSRRHKGKKAAYVKPMKEGDERTLENAIKILQKVVDVRSSSWYSKMK